jgi:hypothetical protein
MWSLFLARLIIAIGLFRGILRCGNQAAFVEVDE